MTHITTFPWQNDTRRCYCSPPMSLKSEEEHSLIRYRYHWSVITCCSCYKICSNKKSAPATKSAPIKKSAPDKKSSPTAACEPLDELTPHLTHGETFVPRRCTLCECRYSSQLKPSKCETFFLQKKKATIILKSGCRDGSVECDTLVPELDCPKLTCLEADQITEEGSCCPICRGAVSSPLSSSSSPPPSSSPPSSAAFAFAFVYPLLFWSSRIGCDFTISTFHIYCHHHDIIINIKCWSQSEFDFCSGPHGCHEDATCRNGIFNYTCQCYQGFQVGCSYKNIILVMALMVVMVVELIRTMVMKKAMILVLRANKPGNRVWLWWRGRVPGTRRPARSSLSNGTCQVPRRLSSWWSSKSSPTAVSYISSNYCLKDFSLIAKLSSNYWVLHSVLKIFFSFIINANLCHTNWNLLDLVFDWCLLEVLGLEEKIQG